MTTLLLILAVLAACVALLTIALWIGLKLTQARRARIGWALAVVIVTLLGWAVVFQGVTHLPLPHDWWPGPYLALMGAGMVGVLWAGLVSLVCLRTHLLQTLAAWLATVPAFVLIGVLLVFVVRPYLLEVAYLRSNSMAPTLLALHHVGTCPHCGGTAYVPFTTSFEYEPPGDRVGMCGRCRRCCRVPDVGSAIYRSDRFVINKVVEPRRWDLVMYQDPLRKVCFAKRVVGLPGEEVVIRDGRVFINGQEMPLPPDLEGLEFSLHQLDGRPALWGTPDSPAVLGPDEFFVLDDFSMRGHDSRMWTTSINGHPPYALPRSCIQGVVGLIYWPETRIRCLR